MKGRCSAITDAHKIALSEVFRYYLQYKSIYLQYPMRTS